MEVQATFSLGVVKGAIKSKFVSGRPDVGGNFWAASEEWV